MKVGDKVNFTTDGGYCWPSANLSKFYGTIEEITITGNFKVRIRYKKSGRTPHGFGKHGYTFYENEIEVMQ